MKKFIAIILVICSFCLVGCGNQSWGLGNYTFNHIHFSDNIKGYCATVEKWYESDAGIEVYTTEYGSMYHSEGTYSLFGESEKCPYCNEVE